MKVRRHLPIFLNLCSLRVWLSESSNRRVLRLKAEQRGKDREPLGGRNIIHLYTAHFAELSRTSRCRLGNIAAHRYKDSGVCRT